MKLVSRDQAIIRIASERILVNHKFSANLFSTHLGNGVVVRVERHDMCSGHNLADSRLTATLIAEGHQFPPDLFKTVVRAKE